DVEEEIERVLSRPVFTEKVSEISASRRPIALRSGFGTDLILLDNGELLLYKTLGSDLVWSCENIADAAVINTDTLLLLTRNNRLQQVSIRNIARAEDRAARKLDVDL